MEAKDINGVSIVVGDRVAFSDAGRGGSVHTGTIQIGDNCRIFFTAATRPCVLATLLLLFFISLVPQ